MALAAVYDLQAKREAIVNAHIEAEAVNHSVASTLATFRHPRYEVPRWEQSLTGSTPSPGSLARCYQRFPIFTCTKQQLITPRVL